MILVCTECKEGKKACTLITDDERSQIPVFCTPDKCGIIRVPIWHVVPESVKIIIGS